MIEMIKRLIPLLLLIGIVHPGPWFFSPPPLEAKTSQNETSRKEEVDYKSLPLDRLEKLLKTAVGYQKTRVMNALAWKLMRTHREKSLAYLQEALRRGKEAGEPFLLFETFYGFGAFYHVKNRFREAVKYYLEALKLETHLEDKDLVANLLTNIGMIYWGIEQYVKAEQYQRRALEIRKTTGTSPYHLGYTLNNLGLALAGQGKNKEALGCYLEALELLKESGNKRGTAAALNNIATEYQVHIKNYPKALEYYRRAVELYEELGQQGDAANGYKNMGSLYTDMRRFKEARQYLVIALERAEKIDDQNQVYNIYHFFFKLYEAMGDFETALEYSKKYDELGGRFFNDETNSRIAGLMAEYDAQKKESEIQLLRKTNENRRKSLIFLAVLVVLSLAVAAVLYSRFLVRKKANRLLESEEAKYRDLFEQAGDAIFLAVGSGYVDCNRKAAEMFGVNPEDIIGRTFADFSPPTQPDGRGSREAGKEWREKVLEGRPRKFPWRFLKKDGTPFDAVVTLAAVTVDRQDLIQSIVRDITESKRLEEERIKAAKLETTTLLAGGLAHDFNNLLGVVLGNIEMAKAELSPEDKAFPNLSRMEKASRSAADLTRAFYTISEKEFQSLERAPIAEALKRAVETVLKKADNRVRYRLDILKGLPELECDYRQMERAFTNIVRNALEAMKTGGLLEINATEVELETDKGPLKAGRYIFVSITDNGEGIPEEDLSRIFDPYFTTRGDAGRRGVGTGLTVARAVIQRHHGNVTVSSTVGKGTTVQIYLPVSPGG